MISDSIIVHTGINYFGLISKNRRTSQVRVQGVCVGRPTGHAPIENTRHRGSQICLDCLGVIVGSPAPRMTVLKRLAEVQPEISARASWKLCTEIQSKKVQAMWWVTTRHHAISLMAAHNSVVSFGSSGMHPLV